MIKHAQGEKISRKEGLKGQFKCIRERRKALNVDEEKLKGNEKVCRTM